METVPAIMPSHPAKTGIEGAWDIHTHVFGPFERFPLAHPPPFALPMAPVASYLEMLDRAGVARGVLVEQAQGRLRAVGGLRADADEATVEALHEAGVRGLRFVEAPMPDGTPRPGSVEFAELPGLASCMKDRGWTANVWAELPHLLANLDTLLHDGVPVVFEHMGMLDVQAGLDNRDFQTLLALVREGREAARLSLLEPATRMLWATIEANRSARLGLRWPYIRMAGQEPDPARLMELFCRMPNYSRKSSSKIHKNYTASRDWHGGYMFPDSNPLDCQLPGLLRKWRPWEFTSGAA